MMIRRMIDAEAKRALESVKESLASVPDDQVRVPFADPKAGGMTALLMASYLVQPSVAKVCTELASSEGWDFARLVDDLRMHARAMTHLVQRLGGDWLTEPADPLPSDLELRASEVRARMLAAASDALESAEDRQWIAAIQRGTGSLDLAMDLESLVAFYDVHPSVSASAHFVPHDARRASALATEICDYASKLEGRPNDADRDTLYRAFARFVPLYETAVRIGRCALSAQASANRFPLLATLSRSHQGRRGPGKPPGAPPRLRPPPPRPQPSGRTGTVPPPAPGVGVPIHVSGGAGSRIAPEAATARANPSADHGAAFEPVRHTIPIPGAAPRPPAREGTEREHDRSVVELEVSLASESNFYLGFTENFSQGGVFVATYAIKPVGERVELRVVLEGQEIVVAGVVKWLRTPEEGAEAWPGMGIEFESLTTHQERAIRDFLRRRNAMFFDE
jgi:uncharacterized protein (TIGR02266 family)